jgi:hypothetical protein
MVARILLVEVRRTDGTSANVSLPNCQCLDMFWRDKVAPGEQRHTCKHIKSVYNNPARYAHQLGAKAVFVPSETTRGRNYRVDLLHCTDHGNGLTPDGLVMCVDMPAALQDAGWRPLEEELLAITA